MAAGGAIRTIACLPDYLGFSSKAIIAALPYAIKNHANNEFFRLYTSECLMILTENTAKFAGGKVMQKHLSDIMFGEIKKQKELTAEEIIELTINKGGLKVV